MAKKVVRYSELYLCEVGRCALLFPSNHPGPYVSNKTAISTSPVERYDAETGEIETANTIYKKLEQPAVSQALLQSIEEVKT